MPTLIADLKVSVQEWKDNKVPQDKGLFKIYGEMKGVPGFITDRIVSECLEGCFDITALQSKKKELEN